MTPLFLLALGLLLYTAAVIKCTKIEVNYQWRNWIEEFRPKFGPDNRDRYGKHRREFLREGQRRFNQSDEIGN